jgi:hypothetical protein
VSEEGRSDLEFEQERPRKIIHIDMDAFYASRRTPFDQVGREVSFESIEARSVGRDRASPMQCSTRPASGYGIFRLLWTSCCRDCPLTSEDESTVLSTHAAVAERMELQT